MGDSDGFLGGLSIDVVIPEDDDEAARYYNNDPYIKHVIMAHAEREGCNVEKLLYGDETRQISVKSPLVGIIDSAEAMRINKEIREKQAKYYGDSIDPDA